MWTTVAVRALAAAALLIMCARITYMLCAVLWQWLRHEVLEQERDRLVASVNTWDGLCDACGKRLGENFWVCDRCGLTLCERCTPCRECDVGAGGVATGTTAMSPRVSSASSGRQ